MKRTTLITQEIEVDVGYTCDRCGRDADENLRLIDLSEDWYEWHFCQKCFAVVKDFALNRE